MTQTTTIPFSWTVTTRKLPMLHADLDYPVRQVVIDGEFWMIFVPGRKAYGGICPVLRFKGKDLEHLERQPDGTADLHGGSGHLGCGMWYDPKTRTLYGLIHTEYAHNNQQGWCSKKTRLATSTDLGLTWKLEGDILTRALPEVQDYAGSCFEAGPADFDFYADERGGYFYVTSWNSFVPKKGKMNGFLMFSEVARCAIAEEIAFKEGATPVRCFPPHDSYHYEPHPESGDRITARKTKIVGAAAPEVKYDGAEWAVEKNEHYYEGQGMVATKAGHTIRFTFQGPDIYWRAVAAKDCGKADVFIDGKLQETVDCFFPECPLPYQFAFIKTGLDPKKPHTIKVVVRGDRNPSSEGTVIRHIGFESEG